MRRYDYAERKRAHRRGREKGCHVYIPAEELRKSPIGETWPLFYRIFGGARGRFVIVFYTEPS